MRAVDNSTNRARSAEAEIYRNVLPFLGRAWQDMVLTRAARGTPAGNRGVAVPSAATARADALRLKRRGELATEVTRLRGTGVMYLTFAVVLICFCRGDGIGWTGVVLASCS